jgi:hypothetical protein
LTISGPNGSRTGAGGLAGRAAAGDGAVDCAVDWGGIGAAGGVWANAAVAFAIRPANTVTLRRRSIKSSYNLKFNFGPIR